MEKPYKKKNVGEVDGDEVGQGEAIIIYGSSADKIFSEISPVFQAYPLCQNARVVIQYGEPGSPQREVKILSREKL